jgi:hypothetical protein
MMRTLRGSLVISLVASACGGGRTPLAATGNDAPASRPPGPTPPSSPGTPPDQAGRCAPGRDLCGRGEAALCFDLQTSASNCGVCGNECPPGISCESGKCQLHRCQGNVTMKVLTTQSAPGVLLQMALGDLDGDGFLDLVSGSDRQNYPQGTASASAFLGRGDGTFVTGSSFPVSNASYGWGKYAAVADLNRDGVLDLVTTSPVQDSVNVRLGVGDGSFRAGVDYGMGANPSGIALADLDADGNPDIATAGQLDSAVSLRFGTRDGTFGERIALPVVGNPEFLAVLDWNQDGIPDLLATHNYLHVLLGLGNGSFAKAMDCDIWLLGHPTGGSPPPAVADFDQDGRLDLALADAVLFGMHECTFASTFDYPDRTWPLVTGDFNGDGLPDLVAVRGQGIVLLTANGTAGLAGPTTLANLSPYAGQPFTWWAVAGDLNGDGRLDLVVENANSVQVLLNTCR